MFSFYPPFLLSLSHPLPLSLSPSPSLSLSMSLCGCKTRVIWYPLPNILFLINLTFHTLSLHSSYKIHQPFTDYFLRLPYSELLEKHLFRSRANRRLVSNTAPVLPSATGPGSECLGSTCHESDPQKVFHAEMKQTQQNLLISDSPKIFNDEIAQSMEHANQILQEAWSMLISTVHWPMLSKPWDILPCDSPDRVEICPQLRDNESFGVDSTRSKVLLCLIASVHGVSKSLQLKHVDLCAALCPFQKKLRVPPWAAEWIHYAPAGTVPFNSRVDTSGQLWHVYVFSENTVSCFPPTGRQGGHRMVFCSLFGRRSMPLPTYTTWTSICSKSSWTWRKTSWLESIRKLPTLGAMASMTWNTALHFSGMGASCTTGPWALTFGRERGEGRHSLGWLRFFAGSLGTLDCRGSTLSGIGLLVGSISKSMGCWDLNRLFGLNVKRLYAWLGVLLHVHRSWPQEEKTEQSISQPSWQKPRNMWHRNVSRECGGRWLRHCLR